MKHHIRPYARTDLDEIVALSLLAWEPVFRSFRQVLGSGIYGLLYPDWRAQQAEGVAAVCKDGERYRVLVAEVDGGVAGFLAYELHKEDAMGETVLLAVHPERQNDGIGTALNLAALGEMEAAGMVKAVVETGGDEGHTPARRSYEKAGYTGLPLVRYFKEL